MTADEVIKEVAALCRSFGAKKVIIYGSRVMGNARECSDIDMAVAGVEDFDLLREKVDDLPTLFTVDPLNLDTCKYQLILEDIRDYGREI